MLPESLSPASVAGTHREDLCDRIVRSLHAAAFDADGWPAAAALIEAACGVKGSALAFGAGHSPQDLEIYFAQFCLRGQRREDLERLYFNDYWSRDERLPRMSKLPDSLLVHTRELYTAAERRTSAAYNEVLPLADSRDSLCVRLDGPRGTSVVWLLADPVDADGWGTDRTRTVERLLPHVRQFMLVRHALVEAGALAESLAGLLDVTGTGVIHVDRSGRIVAANDCAAELLRRGDGLSDRDGALHAIHPADDAKLHRLLERAAPRRGQGAAGSMTVARHLESPRLMLHASPVAGRMTDFRMARVAALLLVADPARTAQIDADTVASALDLTPTESSVAVLLAKGCSLGEIAAAMDRKESTIRWHLKQIFAKQGVSRQADLVRLVLSVPGAAAHLAPGSTTVVR